MSVHRKNNLAVFKAELYDTNLTFRTSKAHQISENVVVRGGWVVTNDYILTRGRTRIIPSEYLTDVTRLKQSAYQKGTRLDLELTPCLRFPGS